MKTLLFSILIFTAPYLAVFPAVELPRTFENGHTAVASNKAEPQEEIEKILTRQAVAWNAGDLKGFMQTYWKSDELTFSAGGKTTRGWQATLDRYVKNYVPPKQMGQLTFDNLEITTIEKSAALVLGDWHLQMNKEKNKNGNFSLVLRKLGGDWKIIHDHSSSLEPEPSHDDRPNN